MKTLFIHKPFIYQGEDMDLSFIPAMIRRRMSEVEKLSLFLAHQSAPEKGGDFQSVFASEYGEWQQTIKLIRQFYEEKALSPAGFSTSVHNAAAGFFSMITKNKGSYTSIAANEKTLEMGLVETLITPAPVLFVYAEEKTPDFYTSIKAFEPAKGASFFISTGPNDFKVEVQNQKTDGVQITLDNLSAFLNGQTGVLSLSDLTLRRL